MTKTSQVVSIVRAKTASVIWCGMANMSVRGAYECSQAISGIELFVERIVVREALCQCEVLVSD